MSFTEKIEEYFIVGHPEIIAIVQSDKSTASIQACLNGTVHIYVIKRIKNSVSDYTGSMLPGELIKFFETLQILSFPKHFKTE